MIDALFIFGAQKLFIISLLCALYFFYQASRETKVKMAIFAFFSLPLTFILSIVARELYFNPLPFVIRGFEPLITHAPNNGFPSDHVLLLAAIASIFIFFHKKGSIALWIIAILVGISRVYVGVHHIVDIVASIVIALISSLVVYATIAAWNKSNPTNSSSL